jgi:putative methyltransferase (TIGR04325 family)
MIVPMTTAIALFGWKRPHHLHQVLQSLSVNREIAGLPLYIFLDGPRNDVDQSECDLCFKIADKFDSALSKQIIRSTTNLGLFNSVIQGVSLVLQQYESLIMLEDDIVVSPYFLSYMIQGLSLYRDVPEVASIHGFTPNIIPSPPSSFFLPGADCWGWATWRHQWRRMRFHAAALAQEIRSKQLTKTFNLNGNYDYLRMLDDRAVNRNNSWAILWHASCFLAGKVTLYPSKSLVSNIGLDGSGEHCTSAKDLYTDSSFDEIKINLLEPTVEESIFNSYSNYFAPSSLVRAYAAKSFRFITSVVSHSLPRRQPIRLSLHGPFKSFLAAKQSSGLGYNSPIILEKVSTAVVDLLNGNGNYERDGTLFQSAPSSLPVLETLSELLSADTGPIVDFGGGLGGTYLNHRHLFDKNHSYIVIEQPSFVKQGLIIAAQYTLPIQFEQSLQAIKDQPLMIIFSSVLQYLEDPYSVLQYALSLQPKYILLDRTALSVDCSKSWWIQDDSRYYGAKIRYPMSPLLEAELLDALTGYIVRKTWQNNFDPVIPHHRGYLFQQIL